jgi:hypothetical protein
VYTSVTQEITRGQQYLGRGRAGGPPPARGPNQPATNAGHQGDRSETGKTVWSYPIFQGSLTNGVLATGGNVVFVSSRDGNILALDGKTGKYLWHFQTGGNHQASPMSYAVDGKQYVALACRQRYIQLYPTGVAFMTMKCLFSLGVVLASAAGAIPAEAQQYAARRNGDIVQLEDQKNQTGGVHHHVGRHDGVRDEDQGQNVLRFPCRIDRRVQGKARRGCTAFLYLLRGQTGSTSRRSMPTASATRSTWSSAT